LDTRLPLKLFPKWARKVPGQFKEFPKEGFKKVGLPEKEGFTFWKKRLGGIYPLLLNQKGWEKLNWD